MAPLGLLGRGEQATIMEIRGQAVGRPGQGGHAACPAETLGLRVGKLIEMLNNEGRGPLLVKVDESRIAIARGMAMRILVERACGVGTVAQDGGRPV